MSSPSPGAMPSPCSSSIASSGYSAKGLERWTLTSACTMGLRRNLPLADFSDLMSREELQQAITRINNSPSTTGLRKRTAQRQPGGSSDPDVVVVVPQATPQTRRPGTPTRGQGFPRPKSPLRSPSGKLKPLKNPPSLDDPDILPQSKRLGTPTRGQASRRLCSGLIWPQAALA